MASTTTSRTNISLPRQLKRELKLALKRRAQIAAANGNVTATSVSAWVREQAIATVAAFK